MAPTVRPRLPAWIATALLIALPLRAADLPPSDVPPAAPRPLLEQLTRETEALYREVRGGLLRVQLPPPRWLDETAADSPLTKYKGLDPKVREALARANPPPAATRFATDADAAVNLDTDSAVIVVPPPGRRGATAAPARAFAPNNVGLLLDEQGHVLVPLYVDPAAATEQPVRLTAPDGRPTDARFVGSDRQTNLTVLKLPQPGGTPLRLAEEERPADGSLVLLVTPADASGRLGLWTGGGRDFAVVFSLDGRCAGLTRFGQFLSGRACHLVAQQIIRHGSVKRATLGVIVTEMGKDDPLRQQLPALAGRTAMRIDQVMAGSAAEKAGLLPGDLLLAVAGESVNDIPGLAAAIAARTGPTEVQILRSGQVMKIAVDLQQK